MWDGSGMYVWRDDAGWWWGVWRVDMGWSLERCVEDVGCVQHVGCWWVCGGWRVHACGFGWHVEAEGMCGGVEVYVKVLGFA